MSDEPRTYTVYLPGSHRLTSRSERAVLKRDYDALAARLDQAVEALRYYAGFSTTTDVTTGAKFDAARVARETLAEIEQP